MALIMIDNQSLPTNLTIQVVSNSKEMWYDSTLIATVLGVVVGAVLTFLLTILYSRLQEKTELKRYEHNLLSTTVELLSMPLNDKTKQEIEDFIDKIYPDLRFLKIKSGHLMLAALLKAKKGEDCSEEMTEIDIRIKNIINSVRK